MSSNVSYVKASYMAPSASAVADTYYRVSGVPDGSWIRAVQVCLVDGGIGNSMGLYNGSGGALIDSFGSPTLSVASYYGRSNYHNYENAYIRADNGVWIMSDTQLVIRNAHITVIYT
tara:strand:+ start:1340 stop:1690 length:351 start_codon:yes stop_codon:yes gene_type:complete